MKLFKATLITLISLTSTVAVAASNLFVVSASQATVSKNDHGYTLQLKQPMINYFSERPARTAGKLSVKHFVSNWSKGKNSFSKDNPNAALVIDEKPVEKDQFVVVSSPKYDTKQHILSFDIKGIERKLTLKSGHYNKAILFIDNSPCTFKNWGHNCL